MKRLVAAAALTILAACGDDIPPAGTVPLEARPYCEQIVAYNLASQNVAVEMEREPVSVPAAIAAYDALAALMPAMISNAPAEIRAEAKLAIDAADKYFAIARKYEFQADKLGKDSPDAAELQRISTDPEVEAAGKKLATYTEDVCQM